MVKIEAAEFPFVESLPKREKSRLLRVMERFQELSEITKEKGMLVPLVFGAKVLGISRQRVYELIDDKRLEVVDVDGHQFLTETSLTAYAKSEHKAGRPVKLMDDAEKMGDAKAAMKMARTCIS